MRTWKEVSRKLLTSILSLCMVVTMLPTPVRAETTDTLTASLTEAKTYIDNITQDEDNDPSTVVSNFGTHFTWDNEKRESSKSYLFDWSYYNGVVFEGLEYVYEVTGDETYKDLVIEYMSSLIASDGTWANCTNNSSKQAAGYNSTHGADCYKTASLLLDAYEMTNDSRYLTMAETLYADLDTAAKSYSLSNAGNNYRHTWASDSTPDLWLDGLYMILPFRAEYAKHIDDTEELDLIVDRMQWVSDNMYDSSKGLFYHAADSATSNSGTYWLRSIGWYAAAIVDIMDSMEGDNLEAMKAQLVKLVDGMKAVQNTSNGMWLNNMNASQSSTNPYETSGTALVCYAVMKAVNEGWLDESYADMAILAFNGICEEKLSDNNLTDICFKGAPGSSNSTFYDNEGKGVGPFIMLYAEIMEYTNKDSEPDTPDVEEPTTNNTVTVEDTTITVENVTGLTGTTVTDTAKALIEAKPYTDFVAYDISATLLEGATAKVSIPVPTEWNATEDELIGISVEDGKVKEIKGTLKDGVYTFRVDHFSAKGVAYNVDAVYEGTSTLIGKKVYTLDTNGVTANKNYLIVNTNSGTGYALTNNNGSAGRTQVSISNSIITVEDDTSIAWVFSDDESGSVSNNGRYVYPNNGSISLNTNSSNLNISNQDDGEYRLYRHSSQYYYYLTYNNNNWTGSRTWQQNSVGSVYLYEYTGLTQGEEVVFKINPISSSIEPGNSVTLDGTVTVGGTEVDIDDCTITWSTSNAAYATVTNGTVTGKADGDVTITATLTEVNGTNLSEEIVLKIPVTVSSKKVVGIELLSTTGTVYVDSEDKESTGVKLRVSYDDETTEDIYVTVGMLTDSDGNKVSTENVGSFTGLLVTYDGKTATQTFTLNVIEKPDLNYPEYPDEGAVKVNKVIADSSQFQNTGVAEIRLSTSGIPVKKGTNVILIMDISNSMSWDDSTYSYSDVAITAGSSQRLNISKNSAKSFVNELLADNNDGTPTVNTLTLLAFAGIDGDYNTHSTAKANDDVYQLGDLAMTETSEVNEALDEMVKATTGGTNYDYAFQQAYNLAQQLYEYNGKIVQIVFMTDGVPTHYNGVYYKSRSNTDLTALMQYVDPITGAVSSYTSTGNDRNGNDIDSTSTEEITVFYNDGTTEEKTVTYNEGWSNYVLNNPNGWVQKVKDLEYVNRIYSIGFGMQNGSVTQGATTSMPTLSGVNGGTYYIPSRVTEQLLTNISTDGKYYFPASNEEQLDALYRSIAMSIKEAATEAYFVDQMGDSFSIQMASSVTKFKGTQDETTIPLTPKPKITVSTYNIYKASDVGTTINGVKVTEAMVGEHYGNPTVIETVTFNDAGTEAYTNGSTTNIIDSNGVICANYFWYNTGKTSVMLDVDGDPNTGTDGKEYELPAETFYWNIGTISNTEFVLSYYVYLDGSAEGKAEAGTYATNNYAKLYYKNWLGNDASQEVESPSAAWESASVYYGFYLVDKNGNPVTNRATGATGSFYDAYKVTSKILFEEVLLNDVSEIKNITVSSLSKPDGYTVYDNGATYTITIDSDKTISGWRITNTKSPDTTYVTDYNGNLASNITDSDNLSSQVGVDYTSTTVWFALLWEPSTVNDVIVIDYGLPVDISVLENDMFGSAGTLVGVGDIDNKPIIDGAVISSNKYTTTKSESFHAEFKAVADTDGDLSHGNVSIVNGETRYTPSDMEMNVTDKFAYEVRYTNADSEIEYYYGDVTVIPATTIYYEDSFVNYVIKNNDDDSIILDDNGDPKSWDNAGTIDNSLTQDEDRPGQFSLPYIDANNIYGYDNAYKNMSTYSLGSAKVITVNESQYGEATFSYYGTGFDIIGLTSNQTGMIMIEVTNLDTDSSQLYMIDTYYGYNYVNGEWVVDTSSANNSIYQIPVMKVNNDSYGHYSVKVTAAYLSIFDHNEADASYNFYLDAIRIYNPANTGNDITDSVISDTYKVDHEFYPQYYELRNVILDEDSYANITDSDEVEGIVFIDGLETVTAENAAEVSNYENYGPNNEVYLTSGQAISFNLKVTDSTLDKIHLAFKSLSGSGKVKLYEVYTNTSGNEVMANEKVYEVNTATDLYQDITSYNNKTIVLENVGSSIISITNLKVTHTAVPTVARTNVFRLTRSSVNLALAALTPDPVFEPETFNVEVNDTVQVGKKATITVTTSNDVENITINDVTYTSYKTDKTTGQRIWTVKLEAETEGEMNIEVFASNADGILSDPITKTITVTAKKANNNSSKPSSNRNEINLYPQYKGFKDLLEDEDIVFIDEEGKASIYDNDKSGKEVYLEENQAITFNLDASHLTLKDILVGIKALEETGKVEIYTVTTNNEGEVIVENEKTLLLNKTSDLYQEITDYNQKTVVIKNTGKATISLTNLKVTYIKSTGTNEEVITMDEETLGYVLETMTKEKEYFTPEMMEVSVDKEKVKVGKKVTVEVVTSDDVECITVNGETCTTYKTDKKTGLRTWKVKVEAEEVGEMMIEVIGYNEINIESLPIENTITVAPRKTITIFGNMIEDLLDMFFGMFR